MYNCKCPVGKKYNKCDNTYHIQALDYRAAAFEALQELDRAKKDAEWILELAPRLPEVVDISKSQVIFKMLTLTGLSSVREDCQTSEEA
jgi:hypothetical protein